MPSKSLILSAVTLIVISGFATTVPAYAASKEQVLHSFRDFPDGALPYAGLMSDPAGNLYGTTSDGGYEFNCGYGPGCGTVFELTLGSNGRWTEKVLYRFCGNRSCLDGSVPFAGLTRDAAGNLYGTTAAGGAFCTGGCGTVFQLTPHTGGIWTERVLHSFSGKDGSSPVGGLTLDAAGNLYGTTYFGGTVFELSPTADGKWTEKVLHRFNGADGSAPSNVPIFDAAGNLYGTTSLGGTHNYGVVFMLKPRTNGTWTEKVLHNFNGKDGISPSTLIFDAAGNLYGTTYAGGHATSCGGVCGTVFELTPKAGGVWTEKVLHSFNNNRKDGIQPWAGLIFDPAGNLYGTTAQGGRSACSCGTVFKLIPAANGKWTEKMLHNFEGKDGGSPLSGSLIFDAAGNLYGTTYGGGTQGFGNVFKVAP
jgi:uncharacterized repeat protein (TIGR03803 family)